MRVAATSQRTRPSMHRHGQHGLHYSQRPRDEIFEVSPSQVDELLRLRCFCGAAGAPRYPGFQPEQHVHSMLDVSDGFQPERVLVKDALRHFGVDVVPCVALRMQQPIAMLVARGRLRTVACVSSSTAKRRGRMPRGRPLPAAAEAMFSSVPSQVRCQELKDGRQAQDDFAADCKGFSLVRLPQELRFAVDKVNEWSSSILAHHPHDGAELDSAGTRDQAVAHSSGMPGTASEHGQPRKGRSCPCKCISPPSV